MLDFFEPAVFDGVCVGVALRVSVGDALRVFEGEVLELEDSERESDAALL